MPGPPRQHPSVHPNWLRTVPTQLVRVPPWAQPRGEPASVVSVPSCGSRSLVSERGTQALRLAPGLRERSGEPGAGAQQSLL